MQRRSKGQKMMARMALAVLAALMMVASGWLPAAAETYTTAQVATNYFEDPDALLGGYMNGVWSGSDGSHRQIYTGDSSGTITQITNTTYDNIIPRWGSGNNIIWSGYDGHDWEVFYYNGSTIKQITNNDYDDAHTSYTYLGKTYYTGLSMNGNNKFVWSGFDGNDNEIYGYDSSTDTIIQITNNDYPDDFPINNSNGALAWRSKVGDTYYVNLRMNGVTDSIASSSYSFSYLRLNSNNQLSWSNSDGNDNELYLYNNGTITQITNNSYDDSWANLSDDGRLAWQGYDGSHYQIFSYKIGTGVTTQVTNSEYDNYMPRIAGGSTNPKIVWFASDGNDYEIFAYDGSNKQQITNNNYDDEFPKVNGAGQILWTGNDGGWNLYGAAGAYSRYDFVYHIYDGDTYTGYVYAPTSFKTFLYNGANIYNEPAEMGGFSLDTGYYNFTKGSEGYDAYWDKKSYITSYYETDYSQSLSVNMDGSATAGTIYVADRTQAHESGYALYNSQPSYFDPFTSAKTYSSTGFSRYDFNYYYNTGGDYYMGYFYAPTDWDLMSEDPNSQPQQMGGAGLAGYYNFYNRVDGFGPSYNKKASITAYHDAAVGATLNVSPTGSTTPGTIVVADRLQANETGYVIYGSSYKYFDPFNSVNFP